MLKKIFKLLLKSKSSINEFSITEEMETDLRHFLGMQAMIIQRKADLKVLRFKNNKRVDQSLSSTELKKNITEKYPFETNEDKLKNHI